jgi:HD superfamily phosphohydrolase
MSSKYIFDIHWGDVEITPLSQMFIDTPEFQRLRYIKSLGPSNFVYPSATSDRFTHCLGVGHLARKVGEHLQKENPDSVSNRMIELLSIAGFMHDIGHGPFSHSFDNLVEKSNSKLKKHEERSKEIVRYIVKKYNIPVEKVEVDFICECFDPSEKNKNIWYYQIISGTVDVDRLDYVIRDSKMTGIPVSINEGQIKRLIRLTSIKENEIYFDPKAFSIIKRMLISRKDLYETVYCHKTALSIEIMLKDLFEELSEFIEYTMVSKLENIEDFLKLDDSILRTIYNDNRVKNDIINRIYTRNFYKSEYKYKYKKVKFNVNFTENLNYKEDIKDLVEF